MYCVGYWLGKCYFAVSGFVSDGYCFDVFAGVSWYFGLLVLLLFWLLVLYWLCYGFGVYGLVLVLLNLFVFTGLVNSVGMSFFDLYDFCLMFVVYFCGMLVGYLRS